ncbi:MAG: DinB family protein, partial [Polaribacter sp.]|nr:DinB family protein [Polaribacter sp.]
MIKKSVFSSLEKITIKTMIPENEYAPYYKNYIQQIEKNGKPIVENLALSQSDFEAALSDISSEKQLYAYETGKWTVKEVMQHVIDTERVFCYRA